MKKLIGLRTIKTVVGAVIAIYLSQFVGLKYAAAAGVITILSIQNTKRVTITIALQRLSSSVLAIMIAVMLFALLGYNPYVFGLYLVVFIPLTYKFKITDGIVVSTVLVTHLFAQKSISFFWIKNELLLMLIGVGIGLLLNLYMPKIESEIVEMQRAIEQIMKNILNNMAESLRFQAVSVEEEKSFIALEAKLKLGSDRAIRNYNNYLLSDANYYVKYMEMRTLQFEVLRHMRVNFMNLYKFFEQTEVVAAFTEKIASQLHEYNNVEYLIEELNSIYEAVREQQLPVTREEFENRALLYQFLKDLEYILEIKRDFMNNLPREQWVKFEN